MLNIIKAKTETINIRIYMDNQGIKFKMSEAFFGKRFELVWGDDTITLSLVSGVTGVAVNKWESGKTYYRLQFSKPWVPFKIFHALPVDTQAIYDGKTIVMKRPQFEARPPRVNRNFSSRSHPSANFDDLRGAIESVNRLMMKYRCELSLQDGVLSGTIKV